MTSKVFPIRKDCAASPEILNLSTYRDKRIVHWYVNNHNSLLLPEEAILNRYKAFLKGKMILDIGVGGGRTAFFSPS